MPPFGSKKGQRYGTLISKPDIQRKGYNNNAVNIDIEKTQIEEVKRRRKEQAERRREEMVAEILRLQDEYQRTVDLENRAETVSSGESNESSTNFAYHDDESDLYPPSKASNISNNPKLAWVDSLASSLNSSMTSQSQLVMAEVGDEAAADDITFQSRILTEVLGQMSNSKAEDIGKLSSVTSTDKKDLPEEENAEIDNKVETTLNSYAAVKDPETSSSTCKTTSTLPKSCNNNDESSAATKLELNGSELRCKKGNKDCTDIAELLTPEETIDLMQYLNQVASSEIIVNKTTSFDTTCVVRQIDTREELGNLHGHGADPETNSVNCATELDILQETLSQQFYKGSHDNSSIFGSNIQEKNDVSGTPKSGCDPRFDIDKIPIPNEGNIKSKRSQKTEKSKKKQHCCKIS